MERVLAGFARSHFGVVTRSQLFDLGFSPQQIARLCGSGRLERIFESTYLVGGAPPSWRQHLLAACWAGGVRSVATHRSAAALWNLPSGEEILEVTGPRWRRPRHTGIVAHESRQLGAIDVTVVDGAIPVTRPARTILDLCSLAARGVVSLPTVELALQEAIRRDLLDIALIGARWQQLGGERRLGGIDAMRLIDRWLPNSARTDSRPENILLRIFAEAGLPDPVPQFKVWLGPDEFVVLDFAWPEQRVAVEFDSYRYHGGRLKHDADNRRSLRLRARNWHLVAVTDDELDGGCDNALPLLSQLLREAA